MMTGLARGADLERTGSRTWLRAVVGCVNHLLEKQGGAGVAQHLGTAAPHLQVSDNKHLETGQMFRSLLLLSLWPVAHLPSVAVEVYQLLSFLNQCFPNLYLASASS